MPSLPTLNRTVPQAARAVAFRVAFLASIAVAAVAQTQLTDDFTKDTSLNTSRWTTSSPTLQDIGIYANGTVNGTTRIVSPQISFSTKGMTVAGVSGEFQATGIQSIETLSPPFTVQATVSIVQSHGRPANLFIGNADLSHVIGIEFQNTTIAVTSTPVIANPTLASQAITGNTYSFTISVNSGGIGSVTLYNSTGAMLNSAGNIVFGSGPFYCIIAQVEGIPADGVVGANQVIWQQISITGTVSGPPSIAPNGVISAGAFGGFTSAAPGSWIEIYGSNLAADTRPWGASDFNGIDAPTALDGTTVTIGGQPAFIDYISSGQVNVQIPSTVIPGPQQVIVKTALGTSSTYPLTINGTQPGLLAPSSFIVGGKQYAVAVFSDGVTYVMPPGIISGLPAQRAKAGDTITLYGVGFGPVTPNIPAGEIAAQINALNGLQISFGGVPAMISYAGLAPGYVGLYQFNVVVPNVSSNDFIPLSFSLDGTPGTQTLYIAVGN